VTALVLDSGGLSYLASQRQGATELLASMRRVERWPPLVPAVVVAESITGNQGVDANVNRFLKRCRVVEEVPERLACRAGTLRTLAGRGSAVDAIVVATAEPGGVVLTSDIADLRALASYADGVRIHRT